MTPTGRHKKGSMTSLQGSKKLQSSHLMDKYFAKIKFV